MFSRRRQLFKSRQGRYRERNPAVPGFRDFCACACGQVKSRSNRPSTSTTGEPALHGSAFKKAESNHKSSQFFLSFRYPGWPREQFSLPKAFSLGRTYYLARTWLLSDSGISHFTDPRSGCEARGLSLSTIPLSLISHTHDRAMQVHLPFSAIHKSSTGCQQCHTSRVSPGVQLSYTGDIT